MHAFSPFDLRLAAGLVALGLIVLGPIAAGQTAGGQAETAVSPALDAAPLPRPSLGTFVSDDGRIAATLSTESGGSWRLGRTETVTIHLAATAAAREVSPVRDGMALVGPPAPPLRAGELHIAATMPEHAHGMVLKPVVVQTAPDAFRVEGVKLHMRGAWEVVLETTVDEQPVRILVPVVL